MTELFVCWAGEISDFVLCVFVLGGGGEVTVLCVFVLQGRGKK